MKQILAIAAVAILLIAAGYYFKHAPRAADPNRELMKMDQAERDYCVNTLSQITTRSSIPEVEGLLGTPASSTVNRKTWNVTLGGRADKATVYFDGDGYATEVQLEGPPDRFKFRRPVRPYEDPARRR